MRLFIQWQYGEGQKNVDNDDNVNEKWVQQNDKMKFSCKNSEKQKKNVHSRAHTYLNTYTI